MVAALGDALDIHRWLDADRETSYAERVQRDRQIGREISVADPQSRVLEWWREVASKAPGRVGPRVVRIRRWMTWGVLAFGLVMGAGIATTGLAYDGGHPVNLLPLLGVLVVIPGVLLLLTILVSCLRQSNLLRRMLDNAHLNRWLIAWWSRLAGGELIKHPSLTTARFYHWQLVVFSQWIGIGFFLGAMASLFVLVAVTDVAFGWSTTLDLSHVQVHQWVLAITLPWSAWLEVATPGAELVEQSRYFRLLGATEPERVARLGDWWPFVMMTLLVWGLLPRVVMLLFAQWRLRQGVRALLLDHPQVTALLDRLGAPEVQYIGAEPTVATPAEHAPAKRASITKPDDAVEIVWNQALPAEAAPRLLFLSTNQSDDEKVEVLAGPPRAAKQLIVHVKSWEPPLLEFEDLLTLLRAHLGSQTSIHVKPVGLDGELPTAADLQVWSAAIAKLRDPKVYVDADAAE